MEYPIYPESSVAITTYFKDPDYYKQFHQHHYGIDLAYQKKYYSGIKYIYAIADGEVTECVNPSDDKTLKWLNVRSVINGQHVIHRYFHFSKISVGKGAKVLKGDILGIEGKTGVSTGSHLELQYWIVPKDYTYKAGDTAKYAVNPCDYIYLGDGQTVVYDPQKEVKPMPDYHEIPLPEGSTFHCLKDNALYYRITPEIKSGNKCGLLPAGTYKAIATVDNEDYTWCKFYIPTSTIERYAVVYKDLSYISEPLDYKALYEEEVKKNAALEKELETARAESVALAADLKAETAKLDEISGAIKTLQKYGG